MDKPLKKKLPPLSLGAAILIADQATKALIDGLARGKPQVLAGWGGDLVYIVYQRNLGALFSLFDGLSAPARLVVLGILPIIVLAAVMAYYFRASGLTAVQRWAFLAMVGGGIGNLIDRLFRPLGVVDFISVKFFGIFGLERWPTFNIADSALVVGGIAMMVSLIVQALKPQAGKPGEGKEGKAP
jgi:signal peptidase II